MPAQSQSAAASQDVAPALSVTSNGAPLSEFAASLKSPSASGAALDALLLAARGRALDEVRRVVRETQHFSVLR